MSVPTRRAVLWSAAGFAAAGALLGRRALAQPAPPAAAPAGPFTLPALGYKPEALEPHIDTQTMMLHHDRHHAAYVANLNAALKDYGQLAGLPLAQLLGMVQLLPEAVRVAVRNNGGGHANHSMFWQVMGTPAGLMPQGPLDAAITRDFGGVGRLQEQFNRAGLGVFGSGWVFVTVTKEGKLALVARPNQDTPLMEGGQVLFGNDVWEHAYYLRYQNRRADYLAAWWNVLDWSKVAARFDAARAGALTI